MSELTIGKLAKAGAVKVDTVRYYERVGLLLPLERTESGYRVYSSDSVLRLRFVRKAQNLGFTLQEIKGLLELSERPEADCADIRQKANQKIVEIEARIADLLTIKKSLGALAEFCPGDGKPLKDCTILQHFYENDL